MTSAISTATAARSTGSMGWALGLTPNATLNHGGSYESAGLKRLTQNVLDRMLTA